MITVSGLTKSFGGRTLFEGVTFKLMPGRRVALVGGNGVGKTTLLEIIVGLQQPDAGDVHLGRDDRIGYLPQELTEQVDGSVIEEVLRGAAHVTELEGRLAGLAAELAATGPGGDRSDAAEQERVLAEYGEAQHRFETLGGYGVEAEARRILAGLGFSDADADRPVEELSGGWRMRVALARLMLSAPELLVLDEPTNHLDVESVAWLEQYLAAWPGAILFVSHDRDFLDAVAERVVEVAHGRAVEYVGGFSEFVIQREERIAAAEAAAAAQQRQLASTERFIERFRYKATKARQVQSRIKALEKLDRLQPLPRAELVAKFAFPDPRRSARVVLEAIDASVGFDGTAVLSGVDLVVERGQKVALVGPNGAGKTTCCACCWPSSSRCRATSPSATTSTSPSSPSTRSTRCASNAPCSRSSAPRWARSEVGTCAACSAASGSAARPWTGASGTSPAGSGPGSHWRGSWWTR